MAIQSRDSDLILTGLSHSLQAMPVDGTKWVGLIHIDSPSDGAMLQPDEAVALRDWLNQRLLEQADISRPEHDDADCESYGATNSDDYCRECYLTRCGLITIQAQEV